MTTTVLFIIGTCTLLFLAFFVIFFVLIHQKRMFEHRAELKEKEVLNQKRLIDATIEVAELEREKIAKDIHDDVGSVLNVVNLHLNRISRNLDNKAVLQEVVTESKGMVESSIETIRGIARDLMPPVLIRLGYVKGLTELCRQIKMTNSIETTFIACEQELAFSKRVELQLYRIVQEVVNNIIKHAKASEIRITLTVNSQVFTTEVFHNGKGISSEEINKLLEVKGGVGLRSIQSRAQMINASVQYITISENRSKIIIEIPINETTN